MEPSSTVLRFPAFPAPKCPQVRCHCVIHLSRIGRRVLGAFATFLIAICYWIATVNRNTRTRMYVRISTQIRIPKSSSVNLKHLVINELSAYSCYRTNTATTTTTVEERRNYDFRWLMTENMSVNLTIKEERETTTQRNDDAQKGDPH